MVKFTTNILKLSKIQLADCNRNIQDFVKRIENNSKIYDIELFKHLSDSNIVIISFNLEVELPLRRSSMEAKINKIEPVFIMIFCTEFPYKAPLVFSDRIDFPVAKLPHIVKIWGALYNICLHRGNLDDWYLEHTPNDFINRIYSWYKDASSGRLIKDGDEFEPMMVSEEFPIAVYSYDVLTGFIENYWKDNNDNSGIAFFAYSHNDYDELKLLNIDGNHSIQIKNIYKLNQIDQLIKDFRINESVKFSKNYIGILAWCKKDKVCNEYVEHMPKYLGELYDLSILLGNDFKRALNIIKNKNIDRNQSVLISAINRPSELIKYNKNIELYNFIFETTRNTQHGVKNIDSKGEVLTLRHLEPLTKELVAQISNQNKEFLDKKIVTVGAGALGSKVILHISRNGYINNTIVDNDIFAPHNLIRHALFSDSIGKKKSSEIVAKLNDIYQFEPLKNFKASENSLFKFANTDELSNYDILLDFSASKSVNSFLSDYKNKLPDILIRGELASNGRLGLLIGEGIDRKPKIDEIQVILFKLALENREISEWLMSYKQMREEHGEAEFEDILIGIGCNTNTMKLSDEIISYHSSIFANYIKNIIQGRIEGNARIMISYFNEKDYSKNYCNIVPIKEFININCDNTEWSIKLYSDTYDKIRTELDKSSPCETGGILLGYINLIKKVIYVVDMFIPEDSEGTLGLFKKGSKGVKEHLDNIISKTGGMISYVGDWHTHPNMSTDMSPKDEKSLNEIKSHLQYVDWPAHIMIFNNTSYKSYIL